MNSPTTWPALIGALIKGQTLTAQDTAWAMNEIMDGAATSAQIAGFGVALRMKGETAGEVSGLAQAMLEHATPLSIPGRLVDLVGTGSDGSGTVNISTMGTIVAAAAGVRMVKHGNRAASSACGAADVLEALGVVIDLSASATEKLAAEIGIAFLFAPLYHPAFRHTSVPRRELGVPTVFNFLGPMTNPARPGALAVGVADQRMGAVLAGVLAGRGCSALVFHGADGLDELTTTAPSTVWVVHGGGASAQTAARSRSGWRRGSRARRRRGRRHGEPDVDRPGRRPGNQPGNARRPARRRRGSQRRGGACRPGRRTGPGPGHRPAERGGCPGRRGRPEWPR